MLSLISTRSTHSARRRAMPARKAPAPRRLFLEPLEDRRLLAGVTELPVHAPPSEAAAVPAVSATAARPTIVVTDAAVEPARRGHPGQGLDGVAMLDIQGNWKGTGHCTATLLPTGIHLVTAAHCLADQEQDGDGNVHLEDASQVTAIFERPGGTLQVGPISSESFVIHPDWNRTIEAGNDLAIIELPKSIPDAIERYDLYRGADDLGQQAMFVGYGLPGTGNEGHTGDVADWGVKRHGWNRLDTDDISHAYPQYTQTAGKALFFDFDNGRDANDAFGSITAIGIPDRGLGDFEIGTAPGDSGGPTFAAGQLAGVHSFGFGFQGGPDVAPGTNSSFGDVAVDARVSQYLPWLDAELGIRIVDDGDPIGFQTTGSWSPSGLEGFRGDSLYSWNGSATYSFTDLPSGWYRVDARTPGEIDHTTDRALYTIQGDTYETQRAVDQRAGTGGWQTLDRVEVTGGELRVVVSQGGNGSLRTDAIRLVPESGFEVVDDGHSENVSFQGHWQTSGLRGYNVQTRYTQSGSATYTFDHLVDGRYEVATMVPAEPNYSTDAARYRFEGGTDPVTVVLNQRQADGGWQSLDAVQVQGGTLRVTVSNGGQGVLRADAVRIRAVADRPASTIDDSDPGFTANGSWAASSLAGYRNQSLYSWNGSAEYQFTELDAGWYQVLAHTHANTYSTNHALYTIHGGAQTVETRVNQQVGTDGWLPLETVRVDGDTLRVQLSQGRAANEPISGYLRADAVRILPVAEPRLHTVDDTDPGFQTEGSWQTSSLGGHRGGSLHTHSGTAKFTFGDLSPGRYRISLKTPAETRYSTTEAEVTVTAGGVQQVVLVDQRTGTNHWKELTEIGVPGSSLTVDVALREGATGVLRADAVRVEPLDSFFLPYQRALDEYLATRDTGTAADANSAAASAAAGEATRLVRQFDLEPPATRTARPLPAAARSASSPTTSPAPSDPLADRHPQPHGVADRGGRFARRATPAATKATDAAALFAEETLLAQLDALLGTIAAAQVE